MNAAYTVLRYQYLSLLSFWKAFYRDQCICTVGLLICSFWFFTGGQCGVEILQEHEILKSVRGLLREEHIYISISSKHLCFLCFKTVKFCYTLAQTSLLISWFKGESALIMNINLVSEENIRDDMIFLAQSCQTLSIWLFPWHIEDVTFFSYPAFLSCSDVIQGTKECGNDVFEAKENFPFCVFLWRFCREGEAR